MTCEQSDVTKALAVVAAAHGLITLLLAMALFLVIFGRTFTRRVARGNSDAWPSFFKAYSGTGDKPLHSRTTVSLRPLIRAEEGNPEAFVLEAVDTSPQTSCPSSATTSTAVNFIRDVPLAAGGEGSAEPAKAGGTPLD